jgi:hypothetical protein
LDIDLVGSNETMSGKGREHDEDDDDEEEVQQPPKKRTKKTSFIEDAAEESGDDDGDDVRIKKSAFCDILRILCLFCTTSLVLLLYFVIYLTISPHFVSFRPDVCCLLI